MYIKQYYLFNSKFDGMCQEYYNFLTHFKDYSMKQKQESLVLPIDLNDKNKSLKAAFVDWACKTYELEEPLWFMLYNKKYISKEEISYMGILRTQPSQIGLKYNIRIHPNFFARV